jgi:hypothetical protein
MSIPRIGHYERLLAFAADLRRQVALIAATAEALRRGRPSSSYMTEG